MEHYDLRSCFLPNMSGLQLRMYQFQQLLSVHLPGLATHLHNLGIQPTYAAQWFLSFFAVTCPLPMLLRIYDVIFAEGAPETIMRVALSIMARNEKKLMSSSEFEDVMQMLLARGLWDAYGCNANDLVEDFVGLSGVVTRETLSDLEKRFAETQSESKDVKVSLASPTPSVEKDILQSATTFLGRLWGGSTPQTHVTLSPPAAPRPTSTSPPTSILRRTPSKQSLSTVSSFDSVSEGGSGTSSAATTMSRCSSILAADESRHSTRSVRKNKDGDLHAQIEDLLMALGALQREHAQKEDEIQALREAREYDRELARKLVDSLGNDDEDSIAVINDLCDQITDNLSREEVSPIQPSKNRVLTEQLAHAKSDLAVAVLQQKEMEAKIAEQADDILRLRKQNNEIKSRWQDGQKAQAKLERQLSDIRYRGGSIHNDLPDSPPTSDHEPHSKGGLREFKLGRVPTALSQSQFNKRGSSLGMQSILSQSDCIGQPPADALLMELVASKTAEAVAKQEAEEAKAKLESLKKAMDDMNSMNMANAAAQSPGLDRAFTSYSATNMTPQPQDGGVFGRWGWGAKRAS